MIIKGPVDSKMERAPLWAFNLVSCSFTGNPVLGTLLPFTHPTNFYQQTGTTGGTQFLVTFILFHDNEDMNYFFVLLLLENTDFVCTLYFEVCLHFPTLKCFI